MKLKPKPRKAGGAASSQSSQQSSARVRSRTKLAALERRAMASTKRPYEQFVGVIAPSCVMKM